MLGKHTLSPNEKADLKVVYPTAGRPGPFEKKITFTTNIAEHEKIEIFTMKGDVQEAPGAKIVVLPRKVVVAAAERASGKKQSFSIANEGVLPLVISSIRTKDGKTVYLDGSKTGNLTVEPGQTKPLELQLPANTSDKEEKEYILIFSNAKNSGESGLFIMVQYQTP
jgi:hypothetical protein